MKWNEQENDLIIIFFNSAISEVTFYKYLDLINPNRTFKSISRRLEDMTATGYSRDSDNAYEKLRVGYLDIEASNLNADFGFILSWCIKDNDSKKVYQGVINRADILSYKFDKRVVEELLKTMEEFDVLYAHYGSDYRFDFPFIRTRAYNHNIEHLLPKPGSLFIKDTYPIAKSKLKLHSNRLDSIARALNITDVSKTHLDSGIWMKAALGDKKSLKYVLDHNVKDVLLLERIVKKLKQLEGKTMRSF